MLCQAQHYTTISCQQRKVDKEHIKRICGHSILLDTVNCWTWYVAHSSSYFGCSLILVYLTPVMKVPKLNTPKIKTPNYAVVKIKIIFLGVGWKI